MDRYRVETLLGEGAMAQVFRATDLSLNRTVALKILKSAGTIGIVRQRFIREAQAAARLNHPNVVGIYDVGEDDGRLFLAMEYVEGPSLEKWLEGRKPATKEFTRIMERVARGIQHAHDQGVVHRDLKPANIIVSKSGEPKVADFGLAHLIEGETKLTQPGAAIGTPLYMSPEQAEGHGHLISARTDVYALGAILYRGLTGRPPLEGATMAEVIGKILHSEPRAPRLLNPNIHPDLETICLKALDKKVQGRYATSGAMADDLDCFIEGRPIHARPVSGPERMIRRMSRNLPLTAMVAALAIAILVGAGAFVTSRAASARRVAGLQKLSTLWSVIMERKREARQLKVPAKQARRELERSVAETDAYILEWPDQPQGYYVRARGNFYLGNLEAAQRDLTTAVTAHPDFRPGWTLLGAVKIAIFRQAVVCDSDFFQENAQQFMPMIVAATEDFKRGWLPGREQEEAERWGLPWTREDQVLLLHAKFNRLINVDKNPDEARRMLEEGLAQYESEDYHCALGLIATDPAEQIRQYDLAIQEAPGFEEAWMNRGSAKLGQGDLVGAIADLERLIELREDYAPAYLNLGIAKTRMGRFQEGLALLDRALSLRVDLVSAFVTRGTIKGQLKDYKGGLEDINRGLQIRPNYARGLNNRASMLINLGRFDEALADLEGAISRKPDYPEAYMNRGNAMSALKRFDAALKDYDRAVALLPSYAQAYYNRGTLKQQQLGDQKGAVEDYGEAIRCKPEFVEAFFNRANGRKALGDLEGALHDYDRAIELQPLKVEALFNRGNTKLTLRDTAGAIADYEKILEVAPADSPTRALAQKNLDTIRARR